MNADLTEICRKEILRRRWLWITVTAVGVLATGLYWLFGSSQLDDDLARLRAQGLPTNSAELNAFYKVPDGVTDSTQLWLDAIEGVTAAKVEQRGSTLPILGSDETPIPPPGSEWTQLEASRSLLTELAGELEAVMRAADAGGAVRFPIDFSAGPNTPLKYTQELRSVARLLTLHAHVSAHDNADAVALQDAIAILATSDALRAEPILISQLIRIAIQAIGCKVAMQLLPHCQWTDSDLEKLQRAISAARFRDEMQTALYGERACGLIASGVTPVLYFKSANAIETIALFDEINVGLTDSWPVALTSCDAIETRLRGRATGTISRLKHLQVQMIFPALHVSVIAGARAEARQNCAILGIAVQRFRLQHGEFPKSLSDLEAHLPGDPVTKSALLTDPFNGQSLQMSLDGNRLRIYSVGKNQIDDGGLVTDAGIGFPADDGIELDF